ncbi:Mov34/MPN/PAD-1 family protein [Paenalcaligenes sp. Me131]|uniref:Mov34/MPN/PAD-1 family protein n=1 Tax=Paenalcaligenes sp. Me131 TaxID=3392636 RepID=UPI003D2E7314
MIEIVLNSRCIRKLRRELEAAGPNEIGGVLAAEQVADGRFLVLDLSVQRNGTTSRFNRDPVQHTEFIQRFHKRMGNRPEQFNYLGEWHSHPLYPATPSLGDFRQMQRLVEDKDQASTFLALLVVKLDSRGKLRGSTHAFRPGKMPVRSTLKSTDIDGIAEEWLSVFFSKTSIIN